MENKKSLLHDLLMIIGEECQRQADAGGVIGDQDYHIESIRRVENDGPSWNFEVVSWSEQSDEPRTTEKMSFVQLIDVLARAISFSTIEAAADAIKKYEVKD